MKNPNKVTGLEAKQITNSIYEKNIVIKWHGKNINVCKLLPPEKMIQLIHNIICECTDKERKIFMPELLDFLFKSNIITEYSQVELPIDIKDRYDVVYSSDLFDIISNSINSEQVSSIKQIIKYYTGFEL